MAKLPKIFKLKTHKTPQGALDAVREIYDDHIEYLREAFIAFSQGKLSTGERISACYPYVKIKTKFARRSDTRLSYGFATGPGSYMTTLTRPDIFEHYYLEQFSQIVQNHDVPLEVGVSDTPIPIHFALGDNFHLEGDLSVEEIKGLPDIFDVADLGIMDDEIANGTFVA